MLHAYVKAIMQTCSWVGRHSPTTSPHPPHPASPFPPRRTRHLLRRERCRRSAKTYSSGVLVASSMHVLGENGVVLARDVVQGELLFSLEARAGCLEYKGVSDKPRYTLLATLKKLFRRDEEVQCVGNPDRHIWANLNSCVGLPSGRRNVEV